MTHTSTQQPNALCLAHSLSGGKLIDDSTEWADTLHAAAAELRHQHARIEELEAQLVAAQEGWCDGCSPDNCVGCGPAALADAKDAARYRWLRDNDLYADKELGPVIRLQLNAIWDVSIDKAMEARDKQENSHD